MIENDFTSVIGPRCRPEVAPMGDEPRSRDQLAGLHDPFRRVLRRSRFPRGRPVHLALRLSQEKTMGRTAIGTAWETVARTSCSRSTRTRAGSPCTRRWALPGPRATLVAYWIAQKPARVGPTHRRAFRVASGPIVARSAFMSQHWFAAERPSPSARERVHCPVTGQ